MLKLLCKGFRILARDVRKNVPELYSAFGRQLLKRWCDPAFVNSEYSPWGICRQAQVVWDYLIKWLKVGDEELPPNMTRAAESEQPAGDDRDSEQINYNPPPERENVIVDSDQVSSEGELNVQETEEFEEQEDQQQRRSNSGPSVHSMIAEGHWR